MMQYQLFISCPRNMEYLLETELRDLGLDITRVSPMGVFGSANLATCYKICLWSRLANRVQVILFEENVRDSKQLYNCCLNYPWHKQFSSENTIAIEFHGENNFIKNTMFGAQLVKDGIVDYFRNKEQQRPNVDKDTPNILIHAFIKYNAFTVSLDLTGFSLHQRGYRSRTGAAPLKENVAAGLLMRAKWPELAKQGYALVDLFCGSGTLLIEAAMMASNTAPGLLRYDHAMQYWNHHDASLWQQLRTEALQQQQSLANKIYGFDKSQQVIGIARQNIANAGFAKQINVATKDINNLSSIDGPGLVITNPPYGERLQDVTSLLPIYQTIGSKLYNNFQGWQAAILTNNKSLAAAIGLRSDKKYQFYNGQLDVTLYCYKVDATNQFRENTGQRITAATEAIYNRLKKNYKHMQSWAKRNQISCYRLYDADLPEYAFAVDIYNNWAHVQEYAPPKSIPAEKAQQRVMQMLEVLPQVLDIPAERIVLKQRRQQKGKQQYQTHANKQQFIQVSEGPAKILVNLQDYLDTGLFLDHRLIRLKFSSEMLGKKLLNCFCYTATVSLHAALSGSKTTNIDMSRTYLDWAKRNFELNRINLNQHRFIQADCLYWLENCNEKYNVIFLDPPSFSNSKRMDRTLDIQRDHAELIDATMRLLEPGGKLYFSNNFRKFKLDEYVSKKYAVKDVTKQTIDEDFKRRKNIHHCFIISNKP